MSLQVASMISAGRDGYNKLRSTSLKRKQQFYSRIKRPGMAKPMNFKPIGMSKSARSRLQSMQANTDLFLQGMMDNADYVLNETTRMTVNQVNQRSAEELLIKIDESERKSSSVIPRSGSLFDTTV
tara:strand:+ start:4360 stop:4737 length:378 start_codon:yes stop_codon:yes gene_type:complete